MSSHSRLAVLVLVLALAGCAGGLSIEPPTFDSSANDYSSSNSMGY